MGALVGLPRRRRNTSMSEKFEYFAVRNSAGLFDSSPLFKYRIHGPDAEAFLGRRPRPRHPDLRRRATRQYTAWCDDRGFVVEDGVIFRHGRGRVPPDRRRAEPRLVRGPRRPPRRRRSRTSRATGRVLADPGPAVARDPRRARRPASTDAAVLRARLRRRSPRSPVTVSRTGYTGDLGYELWVPADRRARRSGTRSGGVGRGQRRDPVRDDRPVHGPDRGRAPAPRRRLPLEPLRLDRRRPVDPDRARPRLDGPRPRDRRPRRSSAATRSGASCATRRRAGS